MSVAKQTDQGVIFEVPSDLGAIDRAVDLVLSWCQASRVDARRLRLNLRVGLSEAIANAMLYGNGRDPAKRVRIEVRCTTYQIVARVTDQGEGFDPSRVPDPTKPGCLKRPCGRGLFLMRKLLDEVHYNERGNSVTLILRSQTVSGEARI